MKHILLATTAALTGLTVQAQTSLPSDTTRTAQAPEQDLQSATVTARAPGMIRMSGPTNSLQIGRKELFRAACCNLGESFVTNPSVDVSYSDAAIGAQQIKLLGLSGTYVQMLTENLPNFRSSALPYALGYVPGNWMKSIQVSKGAASVKNGYEAITGQINVEYLKPEDTEALDINLYGNSKTRAEANIDANVHFNHNLSTVFLGHFENQFEEHDGNDDGFYDKPRVRQLNVMNRWFYSKDRYIFHGGGSVLHETRRGGQMGHSHAASDAPLYLIGLETDRYEAYMKHAVVLGDAERGSNIALMASGAIQELSAGYGLKQYDVTDRNAYASLVYETNFGTAHNLSAGLSLNHDDLSQTLGGQPGLPDAHRERETTPGAYAQYTYTLDTRFTAMAGLRVDRSSLYGTFVTPRLHLKYQPASYFTIRLSAGKGYRTPHALAENNNLLASGRRLVIDRLEQEAAWNYGASASFNIPIASRLLKLNAEYYYTDFDRQAVVDYDSDPSEIRITNLRGRSYSHTMQVDASYPVFSGFTLTAAYRLTHVRTDYGGRLLERPLTGKYKGLVTAQYKTPLEKWTFDATLQLNSGGRLPASLGQPASRYKGFEQLSAQITREFRKLSVYVGGENLTNFSQRHPIMGAENPWSDRFEPTLAWGPVHGAMVYAGIRLRLERDNHDH